VKPDFQEQFQAIMSDAALDTKTKELAALAVSAQVPCRGLLADKHVPKVRQVLRKLLGEGMLWFEPVESGGYRLTGETRLGSLFKGCGAVFGAEERT
jgi:hypothetical protein